MQVAYKNNKGFKKAKDRLLSGSSKPFQKSIRIAGTELKYEEACRIIQYLIEK